MPDQIGYQIDFLPVGNGDRSGDAIAVKYGSPGTYKVLVYDGGTKESGEALVHHIRTYYKTERVDYVVNSHPDADHARGLSVLLEKLEVGELWMHKPWNYSSAICDYFKDDRITDNSLPERLKERMAAAYALQQLAEIQGIPVREPFCYERIGRFVVLSPQKDWYVHDLIREFEKSPDQKKAALDYAGQSVAEAVRKAVSWVSEKWGIETLREDVETTAENESSVVLYGVFDDRAILLTGDAGIRALTATAKLAEANNIALPRALKFIQVPHHGSRHNVSTSVLDRIVGPRKAAYDGITNVTAFVSAGKDSTTHPRKMVINAFIRRGAKVIATQGSTKCHYHNMPARKGWSAATPLEYSDKVEAWK